MDMFPFRSGGSKLSEPDKIDQDDGPRNLRPRNAREKPKALWLLLSRLRPKFLSRILSLAPTTSSRLWRTISPKRTALDPRNSRLLRKEKRLFKNGTVDPSLHAPALQSCIMNTTSLFRDSGWKSPVMAFGPQPRNRLLCVPYPLCENELLLTVVFVCSGYRLGGASFLSSTITARVRGLSIREELYTVIYKSPIYVFYLAVNIRFLTTM
jgi:hypothetical protein